MSVALGVQNVGTVGTSASDLRRIIAWEWETFGIVDGWGIGFQVTPNGNGYDVAEGLAICAREEGYGYVKAYWPGGATEAVDANASPYDRLDAIYVAAHDVSMGDADNLVAIGVAQGTPAATPEEPEIPDPGTLLAVMLVPAGATTTTAARLYRKGTPAIPWGSSLGLLVDEVDTTNADADAAGSSWKTYAQGTFRVPTKRLVDLKRTFTLASRTGSDSSVYTRVLIDGKQVAYCEIEAHAAILATSQYVESTVRVAAGEHTVQAQMKAGVGKARKYWSKDGWAGQTLQVVDAGVYLGSV